MSFKVNTTAILVLLYFCIPKLDIVGFPGLPTGLRAQDLIAGLLFLNSRNLTVFTQLIKKKNVFYFLLTAFTVNLFGSLLFGTYFNFLLGWIRLAEYMVVGTALFRVIEGSAKPLYFLLTFQGLLAALQFTTLVPVIDPGRGVLRTSEYAGSFGTAAELAYFNVFLTAILLINSASSMAKLALLLPLFNGVRAYFIMVPIFLYIRLRSRTKRLFVLVPVIILSCSIFYFYMDILNLFAELLIKTVKNISPDLDSLKDATGQATGDMALSHRVGKWAASISIITKTSAFFFGTGLYSANGALDGGLLRLTLEFGLPMTLLIFYYVRKINAEALLLFVAANLFFDGYISSVVMPITISYFILRARVEKA